MLSSSLALAVILEAVLAAPPIPKPPTAPAKAEVARSSFACCFVYSSSIANFCATSIAVCPVSATPSAPVDTPVDISARFPI